jgi:2-keto-4-pentenoate hydratase/2-oxohepta-3-ene-1,7-dioic acid hydratase in catechol pathway
MRLGTMLHHGTRCPFVVIDDAPWLLSPLRGNDVTAVLDESPQRLRALAAAAEPVTDEHARMLPPLRPGKIVAIGLNYQDHIREAGMTTPTTPLLFTKFTSALAADGETVVINSAVTQRVDWEVELAAVIGTRAQDVSPAQALDHVFGYTVANDLSARDVQFADGQWVRAKSMDGFCPLGPHVVTADEIPDPQALALRTRVNGEVMQDSSTSEMLFGVSELIAFCSRSFTLDPGDVILTGTPWGCGEFMDPPRSLTDGDVVQVSVEGIGTLTNPIRAR